MLNDPRPLTTLEWVLLTVAAAAFLLLATYRLNAPGLYADELLFGPAALHALGQCEVQGSVSFKLGDCAPLYLDPRYLGAAKAWLYAPVFALFDPSTTSVRLPAILGSLLALALVLAWLRREIGTAFAVVVVVVLALDPVYVVHSRVDWGPFVLGNLCKLGLLLALARWRDEGLPRHLGLGFALALLGLYDKLNFAWIIIAYGASTLVCWPRVSLKHLRARPRLHAWIIGVFVGLMALALFELVLPAMELDFNMAPERLDLQLQAQVLVVYYNDTFASSFVRSWVTADPVVVPAWPFRILVGQFVLLLMVSIRRPWRDHGLSRAWRLLVFVSLAIALLLLQMLFTRQLGGAHHLVALWPLPTVHLALLAWIGAQLPVGRLRRERAALTATVILAVAVVVAAVPRQADLLATWRGEHGFSGRFDPGIVRLAEALLDNDAQTIIAVDWGLHEPLVMLAQRRERWKYQSWWPVFMKPYASEVGRNQWLRETYLDRGDSLWITFAPADDVFPVVRRRLPEFVREWGGCLRLECVVTRNDGSPLYQVWRYRAATSCPVPEVG